MSQHTTAAPPAQPLRLADAPAWLPASIGNHLQRRNAVARFHRAVVDRADYATFIDDAHRELDRLHHQYVTTVSSPEMAVSLETATLLWALCQARKPRCVLDLGSGFSSYVLRRYAATAATKVRCVSVDDDADWLGRTGQFLREHHLTDDDLMTWQAFDASGLDGFDLIFHDLGSMSTRARTLPRVLDMAVGSEGLVVLDDVHKRQYRLDVDQALQAYDGQLLNLYNLTHDQRGRYVCLLYDLSHRRGRALAA